MAFENTKEAAKNGGRALRNLGLAALIGVGVSTCGVRAARDYFPDAVTKTAYNARPYVAQTVGDTTLVGRGVHSTLDAATNPAAEKFVGYALLGTALVLGGAYLKGKLDEDTKKHHP